LPGIRSDVMLARDGSLILSYIRAPALVIVAEARDAEGGFLWKGSSVC